MVVTFALKLFSTEVFYIPLSVKLARSLSLFQDVCLAWESGESFAVISVQRRMNRITINYQF